VGDRVWRSVRSLEHVRAGGRASVTGTGNESTTVAVAAPSEPTFPQPTDTEHTGVTVRQAPEAANRRPVHAISRANAPWPPEERCTYLNQVNQDAPTPVDKSLTGDALKAGKRRFAQEQARPRSCLRHCTGAALVCRAVGGRPAGRSRPAAQDVAIARPRFLAALAVALGLAWVMSARLSAAPAPRATPAPTSTTSGTTAAPGEWWRELIPAIGTGKLEEVDNALAAAQAANADLGQLLRERSFLPFYEACVSGHTDILDRLVEVAKEHGVPVKEMLRANRFRAAVSTGRMPLAMRIFQWSVLDADPTTPDQLVSIAEKAGVPITAVLQDDDYYVFVVAAGRLDASALDRVVTLAASQKLAIADLVRSHELGAYRVAARGANVVMLDRLAELAAESGVPFSEIAEAHGAALLREAVGSGGQDFVDRVLALAEANQLDKSEVFFAALAGAQEGGEGVQSICEAAARAGVPHLDNACDQDSMEEVA
jgi:hypothetical protein